MDPEQSPTPQPDDFKRLVRALPTWFSSNFKSLFLVFATFVQLIGYMAMHWLISKFFGSYIAQDHPELRRLLDDLSAATFFILIVKSLFDLLRESLADLKRLHRKDVRIGEQP